MKLSKRVARGMLAGVGLLLGGVGPVGGATSTWDGGGADNNWSTGANWNPDGSVPASASNTWVRLDGYARYSPAQNIASPFVLNRLDFLNGTNGGGKTAFSLSGGQLQFVANGSVQPTNYLNREATCTIYNNIDIPEGTLLTLYYTTYGVDYRGVVSGAGSIDKQTGSGGISLFNPTNSFSGGLVIRGEDADWNKANVYASGAMGVGPVSLYGGTLSMRWQNPGGLIFYGASTHTNPITLYQNSPIFAGMPPAAADTVTLNGPVNLNGKTLFLRGGGAGTIGGAIGSSGANAIIKVDRGLWTLSGANTFLGRVTVSNGTLRLGLSGALNPSVPVVMSCATGWQSAASATFDLNGFSQTVGQLSGSPAAAGLTNILTSAAPAALTVNQDTSTLFNGRLAGALSLIKAGAGTLTLSNALGATDGSVAVSNGTLAVALAGSLGNPAALAIAGGGKVSVADGVTEPVRTLYLDGVLQPGGSYGAVGSGAETESDTFFAGGGRVFVQKGPAFTWDGGGADALMSTAQNWSGDAAPDFRWNDVTFGSGGCTAVVDTAASLYGLTFNVNTNFVVAAGSGVITNGAGGIVAQVPSEVSRTYTIAEDMTLAVSQVWNITNNASVSPTGVTALAVSGTLSGAAGASLSKQGSGNLILSGDNRYEGVTTVNLGDLIISHSNALGSASGKTVVNSGNGAASSRGGQLILRGGLTLSEPLELVGVGDGGYSGALINDTGDNVLNGPVVLTSSSRFQSYSLTGSLRFRGGMTGNSTFTFAYGKGIVSDTPFSLGSGWMYVHSGDLTLEVGGNSWTSTSIGWDGLLRAGAVNVLPADKPIEMGAYDAGNPSTAGKGILDLNGYSQSAGSLYTQGNVLASPSSLPATRLIRSASPATLTLNQTATNTFDGMITGRVSVVKNGPGLLTLTGTNTTFGSFIVSNGTLRVGLAGTLGNNCTNVVVAGGVLSLSNSVSIADQAWLHIGDGAKVELALGVEESVGWLALGTALKRSGTYGSMSSPATYKDGARFTGSGVLRVLHDTSGLLLSLR